MQRLVSHMNFILAMRSGSYLAKTAQGDLGLLHLGNRVIAIGGDYVDRLPST